MQNLFVNATGMKRPFCSCSSLRLNHWSNRLLLWSRLHCEKLILELILQNTHEWLLFKVLRIFATLNLQKTLSVIFFLNITCYNWWSFWFKWGFTHTLSCKILVELHRLWTQSHYACSKRNVSCGDHWKSWHLWEIEKCFRVQVISGGDAEKRKQERRQD